jgi:hypothetical protein
MICRCLHIYNVGLFQAICQAPGQATKRLQKVAPAGRKIFRQQCEARFFTLIPAFYGVYAYFMAGKCWRNKRTPEPRAYPRTCVYCRSFARGQQRMYGVHLNLKGGEKLAWKLKACMHLRLYLNRNSTSAVNLLLNKRVCTCNLRSEKCACVSAWNCVSNTIITW